MQSADEQTLQFLQTLRKVSSVHLLNSAGPSADAVPGAVQYVKVGIVGGSDMVKICEQLGGNTGHNGAGLSFCAP